MERGQAVSQDFSELIDWYKQFSSDLPPNKLLFSNAFQPVPDRDIREFLNRNDLKLPDQYVDFLREVGFGRFLLGENGIESDSFNAFLDFDEIEDRLDPESANWNIDPDQLDEFDLPFFEYEVVSYLVFRKDDIERGSVWLPNGDLKVSDTFADFLASLKADALFYSKAINEHYGISADDES